MSLSVRHLLTTSRRANIQHLQSWANGGSTEHYNMQIPYGHYCLKDNFSSAYMS